MSFTSKDITIGSGYLYITDYDPAVGIPDDVDIETEENELGYIKSGATVSYTPTNFDITDYNGDFKKSVVIAEDVRLKTALITWNNKTLSKLVQTSTYTESSGHTYFGLGGLAEQYMKQYVIRFVHRDLNKRITIVGSNRAGININFQNNTESLLTIEFKAEQQINGKFLEIDEVPEAAPSRTLEITAPGHYNTMKYDYVNVADSLASRGTATVEEVLTGFSFSNISGYQASGAMNNYKDHNLAAGSITYDSETQNFSAFIPNNGYINNSYLNFTAAQLPSLGAATSAQVLNGVTFSSDLGINIEGSLVGYDSNIRSIDRGYDDSTGYQALHIEEGKLYCNILPEDTYWDQPGRELINYKASYNVNICDAEYLGSCRPESVVAGQTFSSQYGINQVGTFSGTDSDSRSASAVASPNPLWNNAGRLTCKITEDYWDGQLIDYTISHNVNVCRMTHLGTAGTAQVLPGYTFSSVDGVNIEGTFSAFNPNSRSIYASRVSTFQPLFIDDLTATAASRRLICKVYPGDTAWDGKLEDYTIENNVNICRAECLGNAGKFAVLPGNTFSSVNGVMIEGALSTGTIYQQNSNVTSADKPDFGFEEYFGGLQRNANIIITWPATADASGLNNCVIIWENAAPAYINVFNPATGAITRMSTAATLAYGWTVDQASKTLTWATGKKWGQRRFFIS